MAQAERVPFLSDQLRDPDFRVRTNAALALGATNADGAVTPLCGALADSTEVVRQAAAAGLQRLNRKSAIGCLNDRVKVESNDTVRGQISRAVSALESGGIGGEAETPSAPSSSPRENTNAKYYVQIASVANRTDRPNAEIDALVRSTLMQKLDAHGSFQIAPKDETTAAAKSAMSKRKLKNGFYLSVSVAPFNYSGGVGAQLNISIFNYPGKSLKATIPGSSSAGGSKGDKSVENQLLERAAAAAIATFEQNVEALL